MTTSDNPPSRERSDTRERISKAIRSAWDAQGPFPVLYDHEADALADAVLEVLGSSSEAVARRWRHVTRGTDYVEVGRATLQVSAGYLPGPNEGDTIVVYRASDGSLWSREQHEFEDGRFIEIQAEIGR